MTDDKQPPQYGRLLGILFPHAGSMFACPEGILLDDVAEEAGGFRCLLFQTMFQLTVGEHKETIMPSSLTTQNDVQRLMAKRKKGGL